MEIGDEGVDEHHGNLLSSVRAAQGRCYSYRRRYEGKDGLSNEFRRPLFEGVAGQSVTLSTATSL